MMLNRFEPESHTSVFRWHDYVSYDMFHVLCIRPIGSEHTKIGRYYNLKNPICSVICDQ